ncbi:MAG: DUF1631 family protein [Candidatus Endonucleobacter sp. (ex Gigantidas childressi)]|nr:DUF1631 family protein [Candidatus Endonucleobacter sp. (ex Gigantidas childressi)]
MSLQLFFVSLLGKHIYPVIDLVVDETSGSLLIKNICDNDESLGLNNIISLLKNKKEIIERRFTCLLSKKSEKVSVKDDFRLIENYGVETNIIHQASSQSLVVSEILKMSQHISSRIRSEDDVIHLISLENIYSSFKKVISDLVSSIELEEAILNIFKVNLGNPMLSMLEEANEFLNMNGYQIEKEHRLEGKYHEEIKTSKTDTSETILLEYITRPVLDKTNKKTNEKVQLEGQPAVPEVTMLTILEIDEILSVIQSDIFKNKSLPESLNQYIKEMLFVKDSNKKLSQQHYNIMEVVDMSFDFMRYNHQLRDDIKSIICFLQVPILRLVFLDQNFFRDRQHPARILLNEMVSASTNCGDSKSIVQNVSLLIEETVAMVITNFYESDIFYCSLNNFRITLENIYYTQGDHDHKKGKSDHLYETDDEDVVNMECESSATIPLDVNSGTSIEDIEEIVLENQSLSNINAFKKSCKLKNEASITQPVEMLFIGQWVEFVGAYSRRLKCQLTNIDRIQDCYIFTNASGVKVAEKSGQEINKALKNGVVNILDDTSKFDKRLHGIINRFLDF